MLPPARDAPGVEGTRIDEGTRDRTEGLVAQAVTTTMLGPVRPISMLMIPLPILLIIIGMTKGETRFGAFCSNTVCSLSSVARPFRPASMPLQTTDELQLAKAMTDPKLQTCTEEEIKTVLRYCYALVGIRGHNLPAGIEKELLHTYIRTHYGNHTAAEVRMAFDMAVQGKTGVEAHCFENFSVLYFASIMNAFRRWSMDQVHRLERQSQPEKGPTAEELKKIDDEFRDYLFNIAFKQIMKLDKLPTTLNHLTQWRKVNSKTG